jgi:hypothetical protein
MHTFHESSMCIGLMYAEEGAELLVFASADRGANWKSFFEPSTPAEAERLTAPGNEREVLRQDLVDSVPDGATIYTTDICSGTTPWAEAESTVSQLGPYRTPKGAYTMHDAQSSGDEELPPALSGLPHVCREMLQGGEWTASTAPANSAVLEDLVAASERYPYLGEETPEFLDHWLRAGKEWVALCRTPRINAVQCGAVAAVFESQAKVPGVWQLADLENDPCD